MQPPLMSKNFLAPVLSALAVALTTVSAFAQAPARLKSTIMSLWLLTVAFGNFLTAVITRFNAEVLRASGAMELLFYAALMLVVAVAFGAIARRFPEEKATAR